MLKQLKKQSSFAINLNLKRNTTTMQEAMSAQRVNTVITAHAEPGPTTRSAINPQLHTYKAVMNEDIANLTTDFGLKKRLDDPTWEKVTPTTYDTKEHIKRAKKKRPKKKKEVKQKRREVQIFEQIVMKNHVNVCKQA